MPRCVCGGFIRCHGPRLALGCMFGFAVLAHTGELLNLRREHVVFDRHACVGKFANTRRGQRLGVDEGFALRDPVTVAIIRAHIQGLIKTQVMMRPHCQTFGNGTCGTSPILTATHLFRRTGSYHVVSHVGRGGSLHTTRCFISDAVAILTTLELDPWQIENFAALACEFKVWLAQCLQ